MPEALVSLGDELGVEFRTGTGIARVLVDGNRVTRRRDGVRRDRSNSPQSCRTRTACERIANLLTDSAPKAVRKFERRRRYEPACSGVVLYLGLNNAYDHLLHHNFVFSRDPHEEFDFIYRKGEPAPDPTCYLASTARTEPETAPPGGDALYVLVHTPYLRPHHDWKQMLPEYRRVILDKLKTTGKMPDIESRIVFESALTPQDIHDRYRVLNGAIYGLASHGKWTGAFKPANRSRDVKGLYLAGGSAHPGPGMPMVLMSGWIAADTLDQDKVVSKEIAQSTRNQPLRHHVHTRRSRTPA